MNENLKRNSFENLFPKEFIRNIDDMKNGFIWFDIWGSIVEKDREILFSLCFAPNDKIKSIHIYPYVNRNTKRDWSDWCEEKFINEKTFCDEWLRKNFNLSEFTKYIWGTISSFNDRRSGGNRIAINYN